MDIHFGHSNQSSVGIEWEMAIVDRDTLEQVPGAVHVLERVADPEGGPIRGEYFDSMLELVSGVHERVHDAQAELEGLLAQVIDWLEPHGLTVLAMGAHPFGDPMLQRPRAKPQYGRVAERNGWWGRQMAVNGLHVHVGVDDADKAIQLTMGVARLSCYFIALSAASPLWLGMDTQFASQRTMLFQQLSTNGPPHRLSDWRAYVEHVEQLADYGMIRSASELRWDVRPSACGTVENRLMDAMPTGWEVGAIAALSQCVAERLSRAVEADEPIWQLPHWIMRENKWRAARYGLDAEVMVPRLAARHAIPMREGLAHWLAELAPIADELGCADELARIPELAAGGPSHVRQRRVWEATGDARAVAASVVAETLRGTPLFEETRG